MRMKVVTTITSLVDINTMTPSHEVHIEDEDGLSEVSGDVLGAIVVGALRAAERAVVQAYPRVGESAERLDAAEADEVDIEDESTDSTT